MRGLILIGMAGMMAVAGTVLAVRPLFGPDRVPLVITDWPGDQMFGLAHDLGIDRRHGLDLAVRRVPNADDQITAFRRGDVEIITITADYGVSVTSEDLVAVYAYNESQGADGFVGGPGIARVEDLRGRTIGVEFGLPSHFLAQHILTAHGLDEADVTLVDVQAEEAEEALRSGRVAALGTWAPTLTHVLNAVEGATLLESTADHPNLILNVVLVRADYARAHSDILQRLAAAVDETIRFCRESRSSCLEKLEETTGRPAEQWSRDLDGIRLLTLDDNRALFAGGRTSPMQRLFEDTALFLARVRPLDAIRVDRDWTAPVFDTSGNAGGGA